MTPRSNEKRPRHREPVRFFDPLRKGRILIVARRIRHFFYVFRLTNLYSSNRASKEKCVHVVKIFQRKQSTSKAYPRPFQQSLMAARQNKCICRTSWGKHRSKLLLQDTRDQICKSWSIADYFKFKRFTIKMVFLVNRENHRKMSNFFIWWSWSWIIWWYRNWRAKFF